MSTSAPRCSPRWTILACVDHGESSTCDVLDRGGRAAGLLGLERVQAADDDARRPCSVDVEIAESPRIGRSATSLPSSTLTCGDLHRHAGAQARGQAGADLEAEQAAAEQRVLVAAVAR